MSGFSLQTTPLPDVRLLEGRKFVDDRGYFSETYSRDALAELGVDITFVQDNQSLSRPAGTLRGLHFQLPPFAQDKLVRVVSGSIWDVAVDLRRSSPTFLQWFGAELSADNQLQLLVPRGFAHGFLTLESNTIVAYKVSAPYSGKHDAGIAWNDPDIDIAWPPVTSSPLLSPKDGELPRWQDAVLFE